MATINQLCKKQKSRKKKKKLNKVPALSQCPQKKGICSKLVLRTPKKPNSALRKIVKLRLTNDKMYTLIFRVKDIIYKLTLRLLSEEVELKIYQVLSTI